MNEEDNTEDIEEVEDDTVEPDSSDLVEGNSTLPYDNLQNSSAQRNISDLSNHFINKVGNSKAPEDSKPSENPPTQNNNGNNLHQSPKVDVPIKQGNSADANRLQQALNKKNLLPNLSRQESENSEEEQGIGKKLEKTGEAVTKQVGGKVITAATGGAVSGPAADAIANVAAKPVGKLFKYAVISSLIIPILILLLIIVPILLYVSKDSEASSSSSNTTTTSEGGICSYKTAKGNISDVKIRILQCHNGNNSGSYGDPVQQELIDFEDYILGVAYQEIGDGANPESVKAQAIAIRNYTLTRFNGSRIKNENGQTVIEMYACTDDQAYCDPENGCHSNAVGGEYSTTMYSGTTGGSWNRGPLKNEAVREAVKATAGQVALSPKGNIVGTNFCSPETKLFSDYGKQGLSAFEILKKVYDGSSHYQGSGCDHGVRPKIVSINSSCQETDTEDQNSSSPKSFKNWKQCGQSWSSLPIGKSGQTVCNIGCAATSVSIQIANSKAPVSIAKLDPGTFVQTLNNNNGFTSGGAINWEKSTLVAPQFKLINRSNLSGTRQQKAQELSQYISNGEYVVIGVHKTANDSGYGHWVALNRVSGNDVFIYDPGQSTMGDKLFDIYPYTKNRPIAIRRYKVG